MPRILLLTVCPVLGWAIYGATIAVGRQVMPMHTTLVIHAVVAPTVFAGLSLFFFKQFPSSSSLTTALAFLSVVISLDLFVVAPFMERSYAMINSLLGTWIPFALIFGASYATGEFLRGEGHK